MDELIDEVKPLVRSILLSLGRRATEAEFRREFYNIEGESFNSVLAKCRMTFFDFMRHIPDVCRVYNFNGEIQVERVSSEETSHMDQLTIMKKRKKRSRGPFGFSFGFHSRPHLNRFSPSSYRPPAIHSTWRPPVPQRTHPSQMQNSRFGSKPSSSKPPIKSNISAATVKHIEPAHRNFPVIVYKANTDPPKPESANNQSEIKSRPQSPIIYKAADTTKYVGDVRRNVPVVVYKGKSENDDEKNFHKLADSSKVIESQARPSSPIKPAIKCNFPEVTYVATTKYVGDFRRNVPVLIYKAKLKSDDEKDSPKVEVVNKKSSDVDDAMTGPILKKQCSNQKPIIKEFATLEELHEAYLTDKNLAVQMDIRVDADQRYTNEELKMMNQSSYTPSDGFNHRYFSDPSRARKEIVDSKWNFLFDANPFSLCDPNSELIEKENFPVLPKRDNIEIRKTASPAPKPTESSAELQKLPKYAPEIPKRILQPIARNIPPPIPLRLRPVPSQLAVLDVTEQFSKISLSDAPVVKKSERQPKPLILPEIPKHMMSTTQQKIPFNGEVKEESKSSYPVPKTIMQIPLNERLNINLDDYVTGLEPIPYPQLIEMRRGSFEGNIITGGSPSNFLFQLRPLELGLMSQEMNMLYCSVNTEQIRIPKVVAGMFVVAFVDKWYRVQVIYVSNDDVLVFFVDHGRKTTLKTYQLRYLEKSFAQISRKIIKASLFGVKPSNGEQVWQPRTMDIVRAKTKDFKLFAKVKAIKDSVYSLVLVNEYLVEHVKNVLIDNGLADVKDESEEFVNGILI